MILFYIILQYINNLYQLYVWWEYVICNSDIFFVLGEKISKSAYKKLRKDWEKQKKVFEASSATK